MGPHEGRLTCCGALKTQALLDTVRQHKIRGLLVGIRHDEEASRGKERVVSPRLQDASWSYKNQPAELWDYYNFHLPKEVDFRIHPLLHWTELDIWRYIQQENLELIPLYFAQNGTRYRSRGCAPCTGQIESQATTVEQIIRELELTATGERAGRAQDQEHAYAMQRLRSVGYM
jgi:sulfate adenylyltransferase subunit 2